MYNNDPKRVMTPEARLSYCHLSQPYTGAQGGEPKYSVTILIPKTPEIKAELDAAAEAAATDAVGRLWNGVRPPMIPSVVWDGDGKRANGMPFGPECKGCYVVTASTKQKPYVCGMDNVNCELAPTDIYSGMYGRVSINFYGYSTAGKRGVACGLRAVMKTRDGQPLGAGTATAAEFAGIMPQPQINPITGQPM